jgi:hypothetical protein
MTRQVADAHAHGQRRVSVVKMTTVLEEYTTEEHRSVVGKMTQRKRYSQRNVYCFPWEAFVA